MKQGLIEVAVSTIGFRTIDDLLEKLDLEKIFVYQIIDASRREYTDEAQKLLFAKKRSSRTYDGICRKRLSYSLCRTYHLTSNNC